MTAVNLYLILILCAMHPTSNPILPKNVVLVVCPVSYLFLENIKEILTLKLMFQVWKIQKFAHR